MRRVLVDGLIRDPADRIVGPERLNRHASDAAVEVVLPRNEARDVPLVHDVAGTLARYLVDAGVDDDLTWETSIIVVEADVAVVKAGLFAVDAVARKHVHGQARRVETPKHVKLR